MEHADTASGPIHPLRRRAGWIAALSVAAFAGPALAQDATWLMTPISGDLNAAANWNAGTVPTGTGFFGVSNITDIAIAADTSIDQFTFQPGASAYSFTVGSGATLTFTGAGVVNGGAERFVALAGSTIDLSNVTASTASLGSIAGDGTLQLAGHTVSVGQNNLSTTFAGIIAGSFGALTKVGTGTLTLTGTSTYDSGTTIDGGTLKVNGSVVSSGLLFVNAGTLAGTGFVPATFMTAGATLAPGPVGSGTGTLTIADRLVMCDCSTYAIKVSASGNDRADVVAGGFLPGVADINGPVRVTSPNSSFRFASPYTILTAADSVNGTFASLSTPAGTSGLLTYDSNAVFLTLTSALGNIGGLDGNQRRIADTLDRTFNAGGTSGSLGGIFAGTIAQNLTQVSGVNATAAQTASFMAMDQFVGLLSDPFVAGRGGAWTGDTNASDAMAFARKVPDTSPWATIPKKAIGPARDNFNPGWSTWAAGYGGSQTTQGVASIGSPAVGTSAFGIAAGADYRVSPDTLAGFAVAGGGTAFTTANLGSGRSDFFQAGGFVRQNFASAYVVAAAAYGWQNVTTDRTLTIAGVDRLRGEFNANALTARLEAGNRFMAPIAGWGLTPYAAGQSTRLFLPSYAERAMAGSNAFALAYSSREAAATRSEAGLRADKSFALDSGIVTWRARAAWAHNFDPDRSIAATFQSLPAASFSVIGASASRDVMLASAATEIRWLNGWSALASFEGEFAARVQSYSGRGVVRYVW